MNTCPKCAREWPDISEQSSSIVIIGMCGVCAFSVTNHGTQEQLALIRKTAQAARSEHLAGNFHSWLHSAQEQDDE